MDEKFETIFGTWIKGSDVENPDELIDPSEYYDWLAHERPMNVDYGFDEDENEDLSGDEADIDDPDMF